MTEEEATKIITERLKQNPDVVYSEFAIKAAISNLMGQEVEPEPELKKVPEPPPSPLIAHTHGLHEKYFPDG